ncbi:MAG TPA: DUF924 family protein [Steroidobacteraceae bacterium]|jgi:uncharacterized protein (DUF924 family)|nr:DUF924 family protein [Steroidobacteraceae bacterium]
MDEALEVRRFWFGKLPLKPDGVSERLALWFGGGADEQHADELVRSRFGPLVARAAAGELAAWADSPRRRLSLILLLDQFPRHAYRGTERAFATDREALALTLSGMQAAADAALTPVERIFFYMPLQHAELRDAQEESVAAYRRLMNEAPAELSAMFTSALESAELHRSIVARFGRFPHRNRALGRTNTAAEEEHLGREVGGESFGQ